MPKKRPARSFEKATNPSRNAEAVQAYADRFLMRCVRMHHQMTLASARLEDCHPDLQVRLITSMIDNYLEQMERRVASQFGTKVNLAISEEVMKQKLREERRRSKGRKDG